jgi:predicted DNA-binding transcriptional regulator AlpA
MEATMTQDRRYLSYKGTAKKLGTSVMGVRRKVDRGDLKPPVKLGERQCGFPEWEIEEYLDQREAERDLTKFNEREAERRAAHSRVARKVEEATA